MTVAKTLISALALSSLVGCAHSQATVTPTPAVSSASVAQPPPPHASGAAAVGQARQEDQDLEALVRGTVIHFEFNADLLTAQDQQRLQKLSDVLRHQPEAGIKISGNCDERGTEEYNLALGQRRADIAKNYLVTLGVAPQRITTVSFGKEQPADPGHSEASWATNRRDEFQTR